MNKLLRSNAINTITHYINGSVRTSISMAATEKLSKYGA